MGKRYFVILIFITFFPCLGNAQEDTEITNINNDKTNNGKLLIGTVLSFSGFNKYRMGGGLFLGKLGGYHHPVGYDYGILFEYNFKEKIIYNRLYGHLTGGASAMLLGGSMVMVIDGNNISAGLAPEIGFGLSTAFKMFYRYNFYIKNNYNSYEVVFHLCMPFNKRN